MRVLFARHCVGITLSAAWVCLTAGVPALMMAIDDHASATGRFGVVFTLLGVMLLNTGLLIRRSAEDNAAYRLGYDIGFERGYSQRVKDDA